MADVEAECETRLAAQCQNLAELTNQLKAAEEQIVALEAASKKAQKKLSAEKKKVKSLTAESDKATAQQQGVVEQLESRAAELQGKLDQVRRRGSLSSTGLQFHVIQANKDFRALLDELTRCQNESETDKRQLSSLKTEKIQLQHLVATNQEKAGAEVDHLRDENEVQQQKARGLEHQVMLLEKKNQILAAKNEDLLRMVQVATSKQEAAQSSVAKLEAANAILQKENASLSEQIAYLRDQLDQMLQKRGGAAGSFM